MNQLTMTVLRSTQGDLVVVWFDEVTESGLLFEYDPRKPEQTRLEPFVSTRDDLVSYLVERCKGYFIEVDGIRLTCPMASMPL